MRSKLIQATQKNGKNVSKLSYPVMARKMKSLDYAFH